MRPSSTPMSEASMRTMSLFNADTLPVDPPAQALVEVLVWLEVDVGMKIEPRPKGRGGARDLLDHPQPLELSLFRSTLEKGRKGQLILPLRVWMKVRGESTIGRASGRSQ